MTLRLSIDIGASITKAVYNIDDSEEFFMKMDSECIYTPSVIVKGMSDLGTASPEDSAWISHKKNNNQILMSSIYAW